MVTPPHKRYSNLRCVSTVACPSLPAMAHRSCAPRHISLRNAGNSLPVSSIATSRVVVHITWHICHETIPTRVRRVGKHQHLVSVLPMRQSKRGFRLDRPVCSNPFSTVHVAAMCSSGTTRSGSTTPAKRGESTAGSRPAGTMSARPRFKCAP